jgi:hypothetical protein
MVLKVILPTNEGGTMFMFAMFALAAIAALAILVLGAVLLDNLLQMEEEVEVEEIWVCPEAPEISPRERRRSRRQRKENGAKRRWKRGERLPR